MMTFRDIFNRQAQKTLKHKCSLQGKCKYLITFFNYLYINCITFAYKHRAFQKYDQKTNKVVNKLVFIPQIICKKNQAAHLSNRCILFITCIYYWCFIVA